MVHSVKAERAARYAADMSDKDLVAQGARVERQRAIIGKLEAEGERKEVLDDARAFLKSIVDLFDQMLLQQRATHVRLAETKKRPDGGERFDEKSLDAVMKDCPL